MRRDTWCIQSLSSKYVVDTFMWDETQKHKMRNVLLRCFKPYLCIYWLILIKKQKISYFCFFFLAWAQCVNRDSWPRVTCTCVCFWPLASNKLTMWVRWSVCPWKQKIAKHPLGLCLISVSSASYSHLFHCFRIDERGPRQSAQAYINTAKLSQMARRAFRSGD